MKSVLFAALLCAASAQRETDGGGRPQTGEEGRLQTTSAAPTMLVRTADVSMTIFIGLERTARLFFTGPADLRNRNGTTAYDIPDHDEMVVTTTDFEVVSILSGESLKRTWTELTIDDGYYGMLFFEGHAHGGHTDSSSAGKDATDDDSAAEHSMYTLWQGNGGTKVVAVPVPTNTKEMLDSCRFSLVLRVTYKMYPAPEMVPRLAPHKQGADPQSRQNRVCSEATKVEIMAGLRRQNYMRYLQQLSGERTVSVGGKERLIATRYAATADGAFAASWIGSVCESLGLEVEIQEFKINGMVRTQRNVVCKTHPPTGETNTVVVIGAHHDSTASGNDKWTIAPGAVDNGSGCAGVLALAKVFRGYGVDCTMHFVFFGAEEVGIHGSAHYLDQMTAAGKTIAAAIIMDMVGYSGKHFGVTVEFSNKNGFTSKTLVKSVMTNYERIANESSSGFVSQRATQPYGSDHMPFINANVPAILAIQMDDTNVPFYHDKSDTMDNINTAQAMLIVSGVGSAAYEIACPIAAVDVEGAATPAPASPTPPPATAPPTPPPVITTTTTTKKATTTRTTRTTATRTTVTTTVTTATTTTTTIILPEVLQVIHLPEQVASGERFDALVKYSTNREHAIVTLSIKDGDTWVGGMQTTLPARKEGVLLLSSLMLQRRGASAASATAAASSASGGCTIHVQSSIPSNGGGNSVLATSPAAWIKVDDSGADTFLPPAPATPPPPAPPPVAAPTPAPSTSTTTTTTTVPMVEVCVNSPAQSVWVDSDGDSCAVYAKNSYCNPDGSVGSRWTATESFSLYENMGTHAGVACCECGGGTLVEIVDPSYEPNDPAGGAFNADTGEQCTALRMFAKPLSGFRADVYNKNANKRKSLLKSIVAPSATRNTCAEACIAFGSKCIAFQFNQDESNCELMKTSSTTLQVQAAEWMLFDRLSACRGPETTTSTTATTLTVTTATATTTTDECLTCIRQYSPVCGADGAEYFNPCYARCHGVVDFTHGNCAPTTSECLMYGFDCKTSIADYKPVCASGVTYYNMCFAQCKGKPTAGAGVCSLAQVEAYSRGLTRSTSTCSELNLEASLRRFPHVCGRSDIPLTAEAPSSLGTAAETGSEARGSAQCLGLDQTFESAAETCTARGMRLCSVDEQLGGVTASAASLSCFKAAVKVWTMDRCPKGRYMTRGPAAAAAAEAAAADAAGGNDDYEATDAPSAAPTPAPPPLASPSPSKDNDDAPTLWCSEIAGGETAAVQCCADAMSTTTTTVTTVTTVRPTTQKPSNNNNNNNGGGGTSPPAAVQSTRSCEDAKYKFKSKTYPTVCGASKIDKKCHHKQSVTHQVARVMCHGAGLRMCSMAELEGNVMQGSGCAVGKKSFMWSGDACDNGKGYMAATALPKWWGSHAPQCLAGNLNAVPRCCADSAASIAAAPAPAPAQSTNDNGVSPSPSPPSSSSTAAAAVLSATSCEKLGLQAKSSKLPTVCASSKISNTCYNKQAVQFETAHEMCRAGGLRLCTLKELENDVLAGSGCSVNKDTLMWTSDTCSAGGAGGNNRMSAPPRPKAWSSTPPQCMAAGVTAVPRCCADTMAAINAALLVSTQQVTSAPAPPAPPSGGGKPPSPSPTSTGCNCIRADAATCGRGGKTYASPCHASCANVPSYIPGRCSDGDTSDTMVCPADVMDRFDGGYGARLHRSGMKTLFTSDEDSVEACAARCEAYGTVNSCRGFEYKANKGICELKAADHWQVKTVSNNVWTLYNRIAVC